MVVAAGQASWRWVGRAPPLELISSASDYRYRPRYAQVTEGGSAAWSELAAVVAAPREDSAILRDGQPMRTPQRHPNDLDPAQLTDNLWRVQVNIGLTVPQPAIRPAAPREQLPARGDARRLALAARAL